MSNDREVGAHINLFADQNLVQRMHSADRLAIKRADKLCKVLQASAKPIKFVNGYNILCDAPLDAMFCPFPADVAQPVEQRFRKP